MGESYSYKSDEKRKGKRKKTWGWGVKSIVLILGIVAVVSLATYLLHGLSDGDTPEGEYESLLAKYEAFDDKEELEEGSTRMRDLFRQTIDDSDAYVLYIYADETSTIQKIQDDGKTMYYFIFNGEEYDEFDGKTYAFKNRKIYDIGEKTVYYSTAEDYGKLRDTLRSYYAENLCAQGVYDKEVICKRKGEKAALIYGDGTMIIDYQGGYFEKTEDCLIHITKGEQRAIAAIPESEELTVVK